MSSSSSSHLHVGVEGFQKQADAYDRARPTFPLECVTDVLAETGEPQRVLDLAAGTGIFTRVLLRGLTQAFSADLPHDIVVYAVEPVEAMRDKLLQTTVGLSEAMPGTAQEMPLPDSFVDVIFIAQAFHWFANVDALREIHRVLRPGGRVVLVWNLEDRDRATWLGDLRDLYEQYDIGVPQYRKGTWKEVWQTDDAKALFSALTQRDYSHHQMRTRRELHDLISSKSYIAKQQGLIERLAPEIDAILDRAFEAAGVDKASDQPLEVPYATNVFTAVVRK